MIPPPLFGQFASSELDKIRSVVSISRMDFVPPMAGQHEVVG